MALVARWLALQQFEGVADTHGDETYYVLRAQAIAAGEGHPGSYRPPGYPAFMALVFALFGESLWAVRLTQLALSLLTVGLVYSMAEARFGVRSGVLSGLACALMPALVHYSHFLWAESLNAMSVALVFWVLDRWDRTRRAWLLAPAGALLGVMALVRETWVLFAAFTAVWVLLSGPWRAALPRMVLVSACAAAVVLPWTLRNWSAQGELVLVSTNRWYPIAMGSVGFDVEDQRAETGEEVKKRDVSKRRKRETRGMSELERERYWKEVAIDTIRRQMPGWLVKKPARAAQQLFSLRSQQLRFLTNGWLPRPSKVSAHLLLWTDVAGYLVWMTLGIAGLWLVPGGRVKSLAVAAIVLTLSVHLVAVATTRFVVPLLPLFALYVGPLLDRHGERVRWRMVGAGVCATIFLAVVLSRWGRDVGAVLKTISEL